jgi:hypothetical protein
MATKKADGAAMAALFDVDGTLADTNYLHAVTWWEAFAQAGHEVPMADIHRAIGMGSGLMLDKLLPPDRDKDADEDISTAHSALYSTYWSRVGKSRPASPRRTWSRWHWTRPALRPNGRCSSGTRYGTCRRARKPESRASGC